jgi:trk system potassium uptake protein
MSGFTTTAATVIEGLDGLPLSVNVWRCLLVLVGGMGIIVLVVAILPLLGVGGMQLIKAETAGPMKDQKLTPRIAETARAADRVFRYRDVVLPGISLGRHELVRRFHAHVLDHGAGWLFVA